MPREVERQSERFANAPHLEDLPDSAYGQHPAWDDDLDFEDMSRGYYNHLRNQFDTPEAEQGRYEHALGQDEQSGYNWGPPPSPHHDPGFHEHEVDPYPHA
jgi:hypothetical protein